MLHGIVKCVPEVHTAARVWTALEMLQQPHGWQQCGEGLPTLVRTGLSVGKEKLGIVSHPLT